jgi:hypothetical protein
MSGLGLIFLAIIALPFWLLWLLWRTLAKPRDLSWGMHLRKRAAEWLWLVLAAGTVALLVPAFPHAGGTARRCQCMNNLKQIGLALHNYHDRHGCYPPAYTTDQSGRPLHGWRTLLLPHLERSDLYKKLRLDEPWDSQHNRAVAKEDKGSLLYTFRCPSEHRSRDTDTSYVMLVGPGTISNHGSCTKSEAITDGPANTVIVVEMARSGIPWMEPRDLNVEEMAPAINDLDAPCPRSEHPGLANALLADGVVKRIDEDIEPKLLRALMTIDGGEDVGNFFK